MPPHDSHYYKISFSLSVGRTYKYNEISLYYDSIKLYSIRQTTLADPVKSYKT